MRPLLQKTLAAAVITCSLLSAPTEGQNMPEDSKKIEELVREFNSQTMDKNPMLPYQTALKIMEKLEKEDEDRTGFWQSYANFGPFLGDVKGTMHAYSKVHYKRPVHDGPIINSVLDDYKPVDAVSYVVERAAKHQFIMVGEEHMDPQSRSLLLPTLRALRPLGYKYFAAETFNPEIDLTNTAGFTIMSTGYYARDPIFAEAVNEAIKLGYTLVPYESHDEPEEIKKASPLEQTNYREMAQAKNLQERILKKDPAAKVLVWAGRGHVYTELLDSKPEGNSKEVWTPMAYLFKGLTGQQPLSLILCQQLEMEKRDKESREYKYAAAQGWLKRPVVFVKDDKTYGDCGAAQVFFPRQSFTNDRADWLASVVGRVEYPIPKSILFTKGTQLVLAYVDGQSENGVAIDCVVVHNNDAPPPLMLPKNGKFVIRTIDALGRASTDALIETK